MMTEIIQELTAVKKPSEISSEQVLAWARRLEALMEATKDNKEFDAEKKHDQKNNTLYSKIKKKKNSHKL